MEAKRIEEQERRMRKTIFNGGGIRGTSSHLTDFSHQLIRYQHPGLKSEASARETWHSLLLYSGYENTVDMEISCMF